MTKKTRTCTGCGADLTRPGATKRAPAGRRWDRRIGWHDGTATRCTECHTWTTWDTMPDCIIQVRQYAQAHGSHFFDPDTLRFFGSHILDGVTIHDGRVYFVTSERQPTDYVTGHSYERRYSARYMTAGAHFFEVGRFHEYATAAAARRAIRNATR